MLLKKLPNVKQSTHQCGSFTCQQLLKIDCHRRFCPIMRSLLDTHCLACQFTYQVSEQLLDDLLFYSFYKGMADRAFDRCDVFGARRDYVKAYQLYEKANEERLNVAAHCSFRISVIDDQCDSPL